MQQISQYRAEHIPWHHKEQRISQELVYKTQGSYMASNTRDSTARAILYAFLANFGIAIAKSWAAWLTGSGSMLAEAIHS